MENKSVFNTLYKIDCKDKTEKKNGLTYLSWSWAWGIVKSKYPDASYKVCEFEGKPYLFDKNLGYMVKTDVTIEGETLSMFLPVMDGANQAQKDVEYTYTTRNGQKTVFAATMFDINRAIMRCLVKNLSLFGLGLYIYAGEDLPKSLDLKKDIEDCDTVEKLMKIYNDNINEFQDKNLLALLTKRKEEIQSN